MALPRALLSWIQEQLLIRLLGSPGDRWPVTGFFCLLDIITLSPFYEKTYAYFLSSLVCACCMLYRWGLGVLMFAPFVCSAKYGLQPWVHIQDPPKNMKEEAEGRRPAIEGAGSSGAAATVTQIARCAAFLAFAVAFTEHALKPFCISARGNSSVFNGSNSGDRDDSSSNSNNGSGKSDEGRSQRDGCNSDEDGTGGYLTSAQTFAIVLAWVVLLRFCDKMALGRYAATCNRLLILLALC